MATLSVIITCKGRLEHLSRTLPLLARNLAGAEIILVDYDCPQRCGQWALAHVPGVTVVRAENRPRFNLAKARNLGIARASAPWLLLADADVLFNAPLPASLGAVMTPGGYLLPDPRPPQLYGTVLVPTADAVAVEGYDETYEGWGAEDDDFLMRLEHRGLVRRRFDGAGLGVIDHNNALRTQFHDRPRELNWTLNCLYLGAKRDLLRLGQQPDAATRQSIYDAFRVSLEQAVADGQPMNHRLGFRKESLSDLQVTSSLTYQNTLQLEGWDKAQDEARG